ncbi:MAG TPA: hypothetical protein VGK67_41550 [Myxococcales bacterium]|jgi:hypothetical protein
MVRRLASASAVVLLVLAGPAPALAQAAAEADPAGPAQASPRSVSATATPDKLRLGETFTLLVEIRDANDVRYELPPDLSLGKEFDVVKVTPSRTLKDDVTTTRFELQVMLFDLGEKSVGDLSFLAMGPKGPMTLTVPGPKVTGLGDLKEGDDQAGMLDILPPVEVPVPNYTVLWIVAATLLATLAALFLWQWIKSRPKKTRLVPVAPRLPAHERALQALGTLQREDLPAQGRPKEFHFRLSEILRDYLGDRFGFLALDMTTEELLATLQRTQTPGLDYRRFEQWCREGDLVKFARQEPSAASCKQAIEEGFGFVRATAPSGPQAPAKPAERGGEAAS